MRARILRSYSVFLSFLIFAVSVNAANLTATNLKCEYRAYPLGIDTPHPRLSWVLESNQRGQVQSAYQIRVASEPEKLVRGEADLWDSGKVQSSQSVHVVYAGPALHSGQRVYWQVKVWGRDGQPSAFSRVAWWEMGLLRSEDWRAVWITRHREAPPSSESMFEDAPAPLFRKEFVVDKQLRRARVYVSGLGYYELHLNGRRVGDQELDPGWTTYSRRVLYSVYDVTEGLKQGANTVGAVLGNGWFNPLPLKLWGKLNLREHLTVGEPRLLLQLVLDFTDGSSRTIASDESWKVGNGPILGNSVYLGERYDARKEVAGWALPGFDDSVWETPVRASNALGPLRAQDVPPIRVTRVLQPVKITHPKSGVELFDFGQNFAGWVRLRVKGPAGARIKLRYGELLYPDGTLDGMTSVCGQIKGGGPTYSYEGQSAPKTAWQQDEYILKGHGDEVYTQHFTFHGFRYVEATALPSTATDEPPALVSLEGLRLNSDVDSVGSFECSNTLFNRIQQMVLWTELSNLFSVESDCPHREKFGYGGDMVAASEMALFNFDMSRFYAKSVEDLADAVRTNGGFTETAPFVGISDEGLGGQAGPIGWGTAHPLLQCQLYQFYGDRRLLEEQYRLTKTWISFLHSRAPEDILDNGISDHEGLAPKPRALTGTAFYYLNVRLFGKIAQTLGQSADATAADELAARIKTAFNRKFLQPGTGKYDIASQACQSFALYLGLVPNEEKARARDVLFRDILAKHQGHLTTGIFGTKFMLNALTELGGAHLAYAIVDQRTFPGWGYMLEKGATTLWEHWDFSDNSYSHNHPMFGSVSEWFYKALAGINPAPDAVGFDKVIIWPQPVADLKWVKAGYNSIRGRLISEWDRRGNQFNLHVTIPVGTTAIVFLPADKEPHVKESGKSLNRAQGINAIRVDRGGVAVAIGSGDYHFSTVLP
jgi:alpha-L-rhamnosidase